MTIINKVSNKTLMPGITPIPDVPDAPTIGAVTDAGDGTTATVAYTAAVTGGTVTTFTATSTPGSFTGTGSSPISVTGLTAGTAYTFKVKGTNATATGPESAASSSITPAFPPSYDSIATVTVGAGGTSTVTFSSIPSTYKHLQLRYIARTGRARDAASGLTMRINSSYPVVGHEILANPNTATGGGGNPGIGSLMLCAPGVNAASNAFGTGIVDFFEYADSNKNKTIRALSGSETNTEGQMKFLSLLVNSTTNISSITFETVDGGTNIQQYSYFALYGIKGS